MWLVPDFLYNLWFPQRNCHSPKVAKPKEEKCRCRFLYPWCIHLMKISKAGPHSPLAKRLWKESTCNNNHMLNISAPFLPPSPSSSKTCGKKRKSISFIISSPLHTATVTGTCIRERRLFKVNGGGGGCERWWRSYSKFWSLVFPNPPK